MTAPCPVCQVPCPAERLQFEDRGAQVEQTITRCLAHGRRVVWVRAEPEPEPEPAPAPPPARRVGYDAEHVCGYCGTRFRTAFRLKRYCSFGCRIDAKLKKLEQERRARGARERPRRQSIRQARTCVREGCEKTFPVLSRNVGQRFCSRECAAQARQRPAQRLTAADLTRCCRRCGAQFRVSSKHSPQRFCSKPCGRRGARR